MQYKEKISEIYSILDSYFKKIENPQINQIHKCYEKLTTEIKISLVEKCEFTFYVNNVNLSKQRLYAEHILDIENSTLATASITSAVPAAEVIALEEVLGITSPVEAQIETMIGVVLLPAIPPIPCLSATFPLSFSFFPVPTSALIRYSISLIDIPHL